MKFSSGNLVIYKQKGAAVSAVAKDKIEIRAASGENKSVREKDIEFLHAGPVQVPPAAELPSPDLTEIVELMEGESMSFAEFTSLVFNVNTPAAAWSAYQILQADVYFTGGVEAGIKAKTQAEIDRKLSDLAAKDAEKNARAGLLERIKSRTIVETDKLYLREVEQLALGQTANSKLMRELDLEATPQKAHQLLLDLGIWDYFYNPFPARLHLDLDDPDFPLEPQREVARRDLTNQICYAIDDEFSHDPDDALGFADGHLLVHIADLGTLVTPDGGIDQSASLRGCNLYLPEKTIHMLPAALTAKAGLGLNEVSDALTFELAIDDAGDVTLVDLYYSSIRVQRLNYQESKDFTDASPLKEIAGFAKRFKEFRKRSGALLIQLPEVKIMVQDKAITIVPCPVTPERELVANAMLAAGYAAAKWAAAKELAMPFSTQAPLEEEVLESDSMAYMFQLRRSCKPGFTQSSPGRHSGLGLEPYLRVTSPLRRYADLLAHQQIYLHLTGQTPLSAEEIDRKLTLSENAGAERRKAERYSDEYWTLVYFTTHPELKIQGRLVANQDGRLTFMLLDYAFEYKTKYRFNADLDEVLHFSIRRADPVTLTLQLSE